MYWHVWPWGDRWKLLECYGKQYVVKHVDKDITSFHLALALLRLQRKANG